MPLTTNSVYDWPVPARRRRSLDVLTGIQPTRLALSEAVTEGARRDLYFLAGIWRELAGLWLALDHDLEPELKPTDK